MAQRTDRIIELVDGRIVSDQPWTPVGEAESRSPIQP
jgi:hypothetical protein